MSDLIDWNDWHSKYGKDTHLIKRLEIVQDCIRKCLPQNPGQPYKIIDIGAGDGRDILEVLEDYPNKSSIQGLLVEIDNTLATKAQDKLMDLNLSGVTVINGDASKLSAYSDFSLADLVLLCGIFGNISDEDVEKTISALPMILKPNGKVIWTRNRREPDKTPWIREQFTRNSYIEEEYIVSDESIYAVGVNRYAGEAKSLNADLKLFTFIR